MRKRPRSEIDARVREAAEILDLAGLLDRLPRQLSGGQRQRVAVGRAIVRKPAVFLFDEPLSNLDARLRVEMRAELKKLHGRLRTTSVYVTHDQVEAMTLGDRVAVMRDGVIQQVGTPLEIYDSPANRFVAGFLGTPPMNFLEGRIESANGSLCFVVGDVRLKLGDGAACSAAGQAGGPVCLGVRPENVQVGAGGSAGPEAIRARVEVVEPLGNETIIHLRVAEQVVIGKAEPHLAVTAGEILGVTVDPGRTHLFDAGSGARLGS
jgi:multiple sugar transport system ATP-binding protein